MMRIMGSIYQTWHLGSLDHIMKMWYILIVINSTCFNSVILFLPRGGVSQETKQWEASPLGLRQTHLDINHQTLPAPPTIVTTYRTILKLGWGP